MSLNAILTQLSILITFFYYSENKIIHICISIHKNPLIHLLTPKHIFNSIIHYFKSFNLGCIRRSPRLPKRCGISRPSKPQKVFPYIRLHQHLLRRIPRIHSKKKLPIELQPQPNRRARQGGDLSFPIWEYSFLKELVSHMCDAQT